MLSTFMCVSVFNVDQKGIDVSNIISYLISINIKTNYIRIPIMITAKLINICNMPPNRTSTQKRTQDLPQQIAQKITRFTHLIQSLLYNKNPSNTPRFTGFELEGQTARNTCFRITISCDVLCFSCFDDVVG